VDEVWYVVSPHNPDKPIESLAAFHDRLEMVNRAIIGNHNMSACAIEEELPRPSYTFHTLRELRNRYPEHLFSIIAGDDILKGVLSWHEGQEIVTYHDLIIRNRSAIQPEVPEGIRATFLPGVIQLSATDVRGMIQGDQRSIEVIPKSVLEYIEEKNLYK
jgi:nicotinate-nucleotide adenylyltransferase